VSQPPLALTIGDPAGIGPEIALKSWQALRETGPVFALIGGAEAFPAGAPLLPIAALADAPQAFSQGLPVLGLDGLAPAPVRPGAPDPGLAPLILRSIETAVALCRAGEARGLVTLPIAKAPLYAAGFPHPGHTEFLGALTADMPFAGVRGPAMMLATEGLRVVLATVHLPLADVAGALSVERIVRIGRITHEALRRDFALAAPRIAIAGLNPHAGEAGALGREEIDVVAPAIAALRALGVDATGPYPADTMFHADARAGYDAALCLYHDQALIPLKTLDFWGGVNITLGLPVVRTSPDHGVGYDIVGKGVARADSLIAALRMADAIATARGRA
jgi:4-hydroxythreonine-4-phosphate dehydrogenase